MLHLETVILRGSVVRVYRQGEVLSVYSGYPAIGRPATCAEPGLESLAFGGFAESTVSFSGRIFATGE